MTTETVTPTETPTTDRTEADVIRDLARAEDAQFQAWLNEEPSEDGIEAPPSVAYWQAFDEWLASYDRRILPIAAREMEDLDRAYADWDASGVDEPPQRFWLARQVAHEACLKEPPALEPPTSVAELVKQNVSPRQIAKIWHILLPDGEPDVRRVEAEIANPGSVITPDHIAKVNAIRLAQLGFAPNPKWEESEAEDLEPPAAERPSVERMILDLANVDQIARAKAEQYGTQPGPWVEIVTAMASLMGVRLSLNAQQSANEGGQAFNEQRYGKEFVQRGQNIQPVMPPSEITIKREDDESIEAPVESESADDKVLRLFRDGHDVAAIAREVNLPVKKVRAAIRKWESEQMNAAGEEVQE